MRVLFLDVDGVLNNSGFNSQCFKENAPGLGRFGWMDPKNVLLLDRVVGETGASIVVSSTWRLHNTYQEIGDWAKLHGLRDSAQFIGQTPYLGNHRFSSGFERYERGVEIRQWMDGWKGEPLTSYAVVDDDGDMEGVAHRFVQTDWDTGMLEEHVDPLIRLLTSPLGTVEGDGFPVPGIQKRKEA